MRTRPGIERLTKQMIQQRTKNLQAMMEQHEDHCAACQRAGKDVYAKCMDWWPIAKTLYRLKKQMRRYEQPDTVHMDMLPGVEHVR